MLIVNERGVELRAKASEDQERQTTEYMAPALCGQRSDLKNDLSSVWQEWWDTAYARVPVYMHVQPLPGSAGCKLVSTLGGDAANSPCLSIFLPFHHQTLGKTQAFIQVERTCKRVYEEAS